MKESKKTVLAKAYVNQTPLFNRYTAGVSHLRRTLHFVWAIGKKDLFVKNLHQCNHKIINKPVRAKTTVGKN